MAMARISERFGGRDWSRGPRGRRGRRRLRAGERGAQALEYIGLGGAVAGMMTGAAVYLQHHGDAVGGLLLNHLKTVIGQ
jgi:hypothetical protein